MCLISSNCLIFETPRVTWFQHDEMHLGGWPAPYILFTKTQFFFLRMLVKLVKGQIRKNEILNKILYLGRFLYWKFKKIFECFIAGKSVYSRTCVRESIEKSKVRKNFFFLLYAHKHASNMASLTLQSTPGLYYRVKQTDGKHTSFWLSVTDGFVLSLLKLSVWVVR